MKVIQVVPDIAHESSGVSYTMLSICRGLSNAGCDVSLYSTGLPKGMEFSYMAVECPVKSFPSARLGRSPEMFGRLKDACQTADVIHSNSLWMMPNIYPYWASRGTNCKLVMQPHGTLSEYALSRSRWKKRLIGWCGQHAALKAADMFVATAESEYEDIRRLGFKQPVVVLPNGVDLPTLNLGEIKRCDRGRRRMFFLSRIHPKKNVGMLIRCWAKLEDQFPNWDLSIVGPDKNNQYADEMKQLAVELGCKRVVFEGELKGDAKFRFMAESDCEVLPTFSENFGMVVAESLACGTPVICSHGAPWEGLDVEGCGWWIATEESDLENAMGEAMRMPQDELLAMGTRGRDWMRREFDWNAIGRKMKISYEWLVGGCDKPEWVYLA